MLLWSLRAAATIALGIFLTLALRRRSAAVRSLALRATLVAAWSLPFAALVAPRVEVALPEPPPVVQPVPTAAPVPTVDPIPTEPSTFAEPEAVVPSNETRFERTPAPFDPVSWLARAYGTVAALLIGRWLLGYARLRRIAGAALPLEAGVGRTAAVGVPATFGTIAPRILLPAASDGWPEARVRAAILHERAHVRRHDWAWQTLAALFAALHWINPFAWILSRALRDVSEVAADDEALRQMAPSEYARELLAVAAAASPTGPALAMARRGGVGDRLVAILADGRDRRAPTRRAALFLFAVLALAGLGFAGLAQKATTVEPQDGGLVDVVSTPTNPGPFTLSDGRKVELIEVREKTPSATLVWSPRGEGAVKRLPSDRFVSQVEKGWRRLELVIRSKTEDGDITSARLATTPTLRFVSSGGDTRIEADGSREILDRLQVEAPKAAVKDDVKVGFTFGPFHAEPKNRSFQARIVKDDVYQENGKVVPLIRVTVPFPARLIGKDVHLAAFDAQGRPLEIKRWGTAPGISNGVSEKTNHYEFVGTDPRRVATVRFETREVEWVRFMGVRFVPPAAETPGQLTLESVLGQGLNGVLERWSPTGKPLPRSKVPPAAFYAQPGDRASELTFRYQGMKTPPTTSFVFQSPSSASGSVWDERAQTVRAWVITPRAVADIDVKVGLADTPWQRYEGPLATQPAAESPYIKSVGHGLSVAVPAAYRSEATEVRVYLKGRSAPELAFMTSALGDLKTAAFKDPVERVARVELWHRPYRWLTFNDVRLQPLGTPLARTPHGPFRLADGHAVALERLIEDDRDEHRVWGPDGSPGSRIFGGAAPPSTPTTRNLSVDFQVWGGPVVLPEVDLFLEASGRSERLGAYRGASESPVAIGRTFQIPVKLGRKVEAATLWADFRLGAWRTEADLPVAKDKAVVDPSVDQLGGQPYRYTMLTLPGAPKGPLPGRVVEVLLYDRAGRPIPTMPGDAPGPRQGRYFVGVEHPERIARVVLRSRTQQTVRFKNVRLVPRR